MTTFLGFVVKEFRHIFRDRRTLVILFGMPIAQLVLFGFAIRNEILDVKVAVVDLSRDQVTRELVDRFEASSQFEVVELGSTADIEDRFRRGKIKQAAVFEPGFARRLEREGSATVQLITDATDPNTANTILAYATAIVADFQAEIARGDAAGVRIVPETRMRFNPELRSVVLFVPGLVALILMLVCALMTSITLTREKETGTMEILLVSPLRPVQIIVGKVLPYLALSLVNVFTILLLAHLVFGVPVRGSLLLLVAECLLFTICALSLGILISARTSSQQVAMMIALAGLLMPTVLLSGFIFPVSSMPTVLQWVSHIVPAKWFLVIIRGVMIKGVGLETVWQETLVLVGMTAFFLGVGARNFNERLG
jgi:ABC-2 type transport system permease protein